MDKQLKYIELMKQQEKTSRILGVCIAVVVVGIMYLILNYNGLTYLDPPPEETSNILIEFNEVEVEEVKPEQRKDGEVPRAEEVSKDIELVQSTEAQHVGTKPNEAKESTIGPEGDVEVPEPVREEKIDNRALFTNAKNKKQKDTLAPQTSREASDKLKEGQPTGNIEKGKTEGSAKALVKGRGVIGALPEPSAPGNEEGVVIVDIKVDNNGKVTYAKAGALGTNVNDKNLWREAEKAALKSQFTPNPNDPPEVLGKITYIFKIK